MDSEIRKEIKIIGFLLGEGTVSVSVSVSKVGSITGICNTPNPLFIG